MNHKHFLASLVLTLMTAGCKQAEKIVNYPLIEVTNTLTFDVCQVDLTDSATILHTKADYIPNRWIEIGSGTHLLADGKEYALTGAEGITPGSAFTMPESGKAQFTLFFKPLPKGTRSFDLTDPGAFKIAGIDLTGKKTFEVMAGVPEELTRVDFSASIPRPELKVGETTLHIHCPGYQHELFDDTNVNVENIFGYRETYPVKFDESTGEATVRFTQYGPAQVWVLGRLCQSESMILAAGDQADVYIDVRQTGIFLMRHREGNKENEVLNHIPRSYVSGTYRNISNAWPRIREEYDYFIELMGPEFTCYDMSADDYAQYVENKYLALRDSIEADTFSPLEKEIRQVYLKQMAVAAIAWGDNLREMNYRSIHSVQDESQPVDCNIDSVQPRHVAAILKLVDINDPRLPASVNFYSFADVLKTYPADYWKSVLPGGKGLLYDLARAIPYAEKAEKGELTEEDFNALQAMENPFYLQAMKAKQEVFLNEMAKLSNSEMTQAPNVEKEKLFDAIVAPHKGKLVVVDFWNTWCGPCRAAIRQNEPEKAGDLSGDDIVWIYIAGESSPIAKYTEMIRDIRGIHYRLNADQWGYLCDSFKIDGIPSYVLVEKDGSYKLTNEFRDHEVMKQTLLQKR